MWRGPSGSGKTLLLRTLAGLDDLQEGEVLFEGTPLNDWPMPQYRSAVSYLHQRPALFEGTVETNLRRPFTLNVHKDKTFDRDEVLGLLYSLGRDEHFLSLSADTRFTARAERAAVRRSHRLTRS